MSNLPKKTIKNLPEALALLLALGSLAGCSSTGYQRGDVAALSMRKAAAEVQAEGRALDQTVATLGDLVSKPEGDLRVPFKRYSKSLDQLIAAAQRTENTGRTMEQKSADYIQSWDQQLQSIEYQHVRELSEARRNEVTNHMDAINRRYEESQAAVQPLISYLLDIRKALSVDLTVGGLDSLKSVVENANHNVAKVQTALDSLKAELTNSSERLSSIAYQAAPQNPPSP
jgi:hypothetical protein